MCYDTTEVIIFSTVFFYFFLLLLFVVDNDDDYDYDMKAGVTRFGKKRNAFYSECDMDVTMKAQHDEPPDQL